MHTILIVWPVVASYGSLDCDWIITVWGWGLLNSHLDALTFPSIVTSSFTNLFDAVNFQVSGYYSNDQVLYLMSQSVLRDSMKWVDMRWCFFGRFFLPGGIYLWGMYCGDSQQTKATGSLCGSITTVTVSRSVTWYPKTMSEVSENKWKSKSFKIFTDAYIYYEY